MESTAVPLPALGGGYIHLGVSRDITERAAAGRALADSRERLARALDREQEQGRMLRRVADAALTIHAAGTLVDTLRVVAEEARRILGAERAVASLAVDDASAPEFG